MSATAWLTVGQVLGVYGVRGFFKIRSFTEIPSQIVHYTPWQLLLLERQQCFTIETFALHKLILVKLTGIDSPEQGRLWLQASIQVPASCLPALAPGEFYWWQILGAAVINQEGIALGVLTEVIDNPAHPLLLLTDDAGKERLIPWVRKEIIQEIDFEEKIIKVAWQTHWND